MGVVLSEGPQQLLEWVADRPAQWGYAWMVLVPIAALIAPRLQPAVVKPVVLASSTLASVGVIDQEFERMPRSIATQHLSFSGRGELLGTYVWDRCTLRPAHMPEHGQRQDLHVRTSYIPDALLPSILGQIDDAGVRGLHLGFYTAPRSLEPLAEWQELRYLTFEGDHLTDAAMLPLSRLGELRMLEIGVRPNEVNSVTDDGLHHLAELRNLQYLGLHAFQGIQGDGLRHLGRLGALRELELSYTEVDDDGLRHLRNLSQLRTLSLQHTRVTDAGIAHLAQLPNLKTLDLRQTAVSPAIAPLLASFPSLERVVLHHNLQFEVIEAVRAQGLVADGFGWIRGTVGCEHWPRM